MMFYVFTTHFTTQLSAVLFVLGSYRRSDSVSLNKTITKGVRHLQCMQNYIFRNFHAHMLIHLKDGSEERSVTPVKCSLCKKGFKTWDGLKNHLTKKHLAEGEEVKLVCFHILHATTVLDG